MRVDLKRVVRRGIGWLVIASLMPATMGIVTLASGRGYLPGVAYGLAVDLSVVAFVGGLHVVVGLLAWAFFE